MEQVVPLSPLAGSRDAEISLLAASRASHSSLGCASGARADAGAEAPQGFWAPSQGLEASALNRDQFCAFHDQTQGLNHTHRGVHRSREARQGAQGSLPAGRPRP